MILEEQRFLHEDLERLEQGIADRVAEDPRNVRPIHTPRPPPTAIVPKLILEDSREAISRPSDSWFSISDTEPV